MATISSCLQGDSTGPPQSPQNSVNRFTFRQTISSGVNMQVQEEVRRGKLHSHFPEPAIRCEPTKVPLSSVVASLLPANAFLHTAHVRDQNILHGPWHYLSDHLPDTVHRGATHDQIATKGSFANLDPQSHTMALPCNSAFLFSSPNDDSFADFSLANRLPARRREIPGLKSRLVRNWH